MHFTSKLFNCNDVNKNGHIYTKEVVDAAITAPVFVDLLVNGSLFGDIEFSNYCLGAIDAAGSFDVTRAAFVLDNYYWEDNVLVGEFTTLDTPEGERLVQLFEDNYFRDNTDFISPFGTGTINSFGKVEQYTITAFSAVKNKA